MTSKIVSKLETVTFCLKIWAIIEENEVIFFKPIIPYQVDTDMRPPDMTLRLLDTEERFG